MGKYKKLEMLQKLRESGTLSEKDFEVEKNKVLNNRNNIAKQIKIILFSVIFIIIMVIIVILFNDNSKKKLKEPSSTDTEETSNKVTALSEISFNNMKNENEKLKLDKSQQTILNYFDNDYFNIMDTDVQDLMRYPSIYKNSKISINCVAVKIIKSTAEEYEILVVPDSEGYLSDTYSLVSLSEFSDSLILIKGSQLVERILEGDSISVYGRYVDVETLELEGKSYTVPKISVTEISGFYSRFDEDTITTVAKYIFGENIKIRQGITPYGGEQPDSRYVDLEFDVVTLDNQSNENFKAFNICKNFGYIEYNWRVHNLPSTIVKKLFISTDFQHYIVTTFDSGTEHAYIEYFDRELKKLWSREFNYNTNSTTDISPIDYTSKKMAVVIDNDLYIIDMDTGEDIVSPILVGEKIKLVMLKDSILLVGNNNKDAIMRVDYQGNIIQKDNANTSMSKISETQIQHIDDRTVIKLSGQYETTDIYTPYISMSKYIVLDESGNIEVSTTDR